MALSRRCRSANRQAGTRQTRSSYRPAVPGDDLEDRDRDRRSGGKQLPTTLPARENVEQLEDAATHDLAEIGKCVRGDGADPHHHCDQRRRCRQQDGTRGAARFRAKQQHDSPDHERPRQHDRSQVMGNRRRDHREDRNQGVHDRRMRAPTPSIDGPEGQQRKRERQALVCELGVEEQEAGVARVDERSNARDPRAPGDGLDEEEQANHDDDAGDADEYHGYGKQRQTRREHHRCRRCLEPGVRRAESQEWIRGEEVAAGKDVVDGAPVRELVGKRQRRRARQNLDRVQRETEGHDARETFPAIRVPADEPEGCRHNHDDDPGPPDQERVRVRAPGKLSGEDDHEQAECHGHEQPRQKRRSDGPRCVRAGARPSPGVCLGQRAGEASLRRGRAGGRRSGQICRTCGCRLLARHWSLAGHRGRSRRRRLVRCGAASSRVPHRPRAWPAGTSAATEAEAPPADVRDRADSHSQHFIA